MIGLSFSAWWLARHEEDIRECEQALAERRLQALMPSAEVKWCQQEDDWQGMTL